MLMTSCGEHMLVLILAILSCHSLGMLLRASALLWTCCIPSWGILSDIIPTDLSTCLLFNI